MRDKAKLFTEDSTSAAAFMQPTAPPHGAMDSRRMDAKGKAAAINGGIQSPYGKGYARNSSRATLIPMDPMDTTPHPIPAHPAHPIGKKKRA